MGPGRAAYYKGTRAGFKFFASKLRTVELLFYLCGMFNTISTLPAPTLAAIAGLTFLAVSFIASFIQTRLQS